MDGFERVIGMIPVMHLVCLCLVKVLATLRNTVDKIKLDHESINKVIPPCHLFSVDRVDKFHVQAPILINSMFEPKV